MFSKVQIHSKDKTNSKPRPPNRNLNLARQQPHPATSVQRSLLDPKSLTPNNVLQLQRAIGNQTVVRLLAHATQNQPTVQRVEWESEYFKNVGFKLGDLSRAARKQHTPETCWAAALAIGSTLLGRMDWNNELRWYGAGRRASLVMEKSTRILPEDLRTLVNGIRGFTFEIYDMRGLAALIGDALKNDKVILLMSEEHVVVLGQLQLDKRTGTITNYYVIDSASGKPESWTQEKFNSFQPSYGAIMS